MPAAPLPQDEAERLAALRSYDILDTACEHSFDTLTRLAARLTGSPIALVSLLDADRQWFKSRVGLDAQETPRNLAFCAHAILQPGQPLVVADARVDPRFADNALVTGDPRIRFYAGIPLLSTEQQPLGTLCIIDREPREIDAPTLETLRGLAQAVETTLELRRAMRTVESMALTDALTGLPNRRAFLDHLGRAVARQQRDGRPLSLLYLDLDGFKGVNDRVGHAEGDAVLKGVAETLGALIRGGDVAARLGGDEFAAILLGGDGQEAPAVAERLRAAIARRMAEGGWPVTSSVGAATCRVPPANSQALIDLADALMYQAKVKGGNRVAAGALGDAPRRADAA